MPTPADPPLGSKRRKPYPASVPVFLGTRALNMGGSPPSASQITQGQSESRKGAASRLSFLRVCGASRGVGRGCPRAGLPWCVPEVQAPWWRGLWAGWCALELEPAVLPDCRGSCLCSALVARFCFTVLGPGCTAMPAQSSFCPASCAAEEALLFQGGRAHPMTLPHRMLGTP